MIRNAVPAPYSSPFVHELGGDRRVVLDAAIRVDVVASQIFNKSHKSIRESVPYCIYLFLHHAREDFCLATALCPRVGHRQPTMRIGHLLPAFRDSVGARLPSAYESYRARR